MKQPTPCRHATALHPFLFSCAASTRSSQAGFSLVELVIIIVIVGVLAVVALPRFDYSGPQVTATSRKLVEDLRYAQGRAVATQIRHGLILTGCTGGAVCTGYRVSEFDANKNPTVLAKDPLTGQDFEMLMTGSHDGVRLDTTLVGQTIQFDVMGSPCGGVGAGCVALTRLPLPTNTIDIRKDSSCARIAITVTTGLVEREDQCL